GGGSRGGATRRGGTAAGARGPAAPLRHTRPLSLVLFDVDRFKTINDDFGHLAGDRVLQGIASVAAKQVRRDELIARYGGEEFAVVLPETTADDAAKFCERIRAAVENERVEFDGSASRATISLGAAALEPADTMETLVARADANLYRPKAAGRNRVVTGRSGSASADTESSRADAARR